MKYFSNQYSNQLKLFTAVIFLFALLVSCSNKSILKKEEVPIDSRVTIGPGDEIEIKFFNVPELNEIQTVRYDGNISLHLVGDVKVESKTIPEVKDTLITLFTPHLQSPEILVIPRTLFNSMVHVGGEVNAPGSFSMPGKLTALEAIMQAGGFDLNTASAGDVIIVRLKDNSRFLAKLDLSAALKGKDVNPFYLEPRDIVYVPRTKITALVKWIDKNFYAILPPGFTYTRPIGEGDIGLRTFIIR